MTRWDNKTRWRAKGLWMGGAVTEDPLKMPAMAIGSEGRTGTAYKYERALHDEGRRGLPVRSRTGTTRRTEF